ncbi:MAG: EamA family transporter [Clostridia bacterium]|nr:EamA family transporter [Clostridia bacterium]
MQYIWVLFILIYGIVKGLREGLKKKAMEKNSIIEVLFFYTLFGFFMTIPFSRDIFQVSALFHLVLIVKAGIIFVAWLCALNSIKLLPLSIYSVLDMGRVIFAVLLGVLLLGEKLGIFQIIGIALVILGITLVNLKTKRGVEEKPSKKVILLVLFSGILNSISSTMDKWLMATDTNRWLLGSAEISSAQIQFWYMLYLTILYGLYIFFKNEKVNVRKCVTSPWIWIMSLIFVLGDRCLFLANADPNSTVVVMTLIKQSSVLVTIFMGKLVFKEKHIAYRIFCAITIIAGIMISLI